MARYRKKPVEIEAVRFTEADKDRVLNWMEGSRWPDFEDGEPVLRFQTIHGDTATARLGDWIAQDAEPGTYYPIKHIVFEALYEPVED